MSLYFQSLCSGSSGNSLLLRTDSTTLLIDAGFNSMRKCRKALIDVLPRLDGVVVTHLHTDHIHYSSLRVLEDCGIPIYVYEKDIPILARSHFRRSPFLDLKIRPFREQPLRIRDFLITPFGVPHDRSRKTFGFDLSVDQKGRKKRIVAAADFWDWRNLTARFEGADFIYIEANHDRELLRLYPNPHSHYHLSNEGCGKLLREALAGGKIPEAGIMLGHLSEIRNRPKLAREEILESLAGIRSFRDGGLYIAPRHEPSACVRI